MSSNTKTVKEILRDNNNIFKSFLFNNNYNIKFKKYKKFKTIIVIGMGGSILGAKAIYYFLKYKIKKKFIFIDDLNEKYLEQVKKENNLSNCLFLVISKSGNTSETILNLYYFKFFLKKNNTIIISENNNNFLKGFANKNKFFFLEHKKFIGGRYSVLTDVGMLPAFFMGLKTELFKMSFKKFLNNMKFLENSANKIKKLNIKKTKIIIFFNYVPELNNFLYWGQQLFAESLGKNRKGFMPVVSNAPKDHHSLLQLYLDGPRDKVFYIFSNKKKKSMKINSTFFGKKINYLNKKKYDQIKHAQKDAFLKVLKIKKIPFREIFIEKLDENSLGKLFLLFIFETILLGKFINVNPFDQPAVEDVKISTKEILNSGKF